MDSPLQSSYGSPIYRIKTLKELPRILCYTGVLLEGLKEWVELFGLAIVQLPWKFGCQVDTVLPPLRGLFAKIRGLLLGGPGAGGFGSGPEGPDGHGGPGGPPGGGPPSCGPGIPPGGPLSSRVGAPDGTELGPRPAAIGIAMTREVGSHMVSDGSKEMLHLCPATAMHTGAPLVVAGAAAGNSTAALRRLATRDCQDGVPTPCPLPCPWSLSCCQTMTETLGSS
eukprot:10834729-Ditylum_brightwellii.AAC.1